MAENKMNKILREQYAEYLRTHILRPQSWIEEEVGEFNLPSNPPTATAIRNYFISIIENEVENDKISALKELYFPQNNIKSKQSVIEAIEKIDKTKTIEKFFAGHSPNKIYLNFIAQFFDTPIKSIDEFELYQKGKRIESTEFIPSIHAPNEINDIVEQSSKKMYSMKVIKIMTFLTIFLIAGIAILVSYHNLKAEKKIMIEKENFWNNIHQRSFIVRDIGDTLFTEYEFQPSKNSTDENTLTVVLTDSLSVKFYTNTIYNDKYIYTTKPNWNFETDSVEDMNSYRYGGNYKKHIHPTHINRNGSRVNIANEEMIIGFNLFNKCKRRLYISNIDIEIIETYTVDAQTTEYGVYTKRSSEDLITIQFNCSDNIYPNMVETKIEPGGKLFVNSLEIKCCNPSCLNTVSKFKIAITCRTGEGNTADNILTVYSDKDYFIGYVTP